ncbi:MAG: FAD-dependent oxidoreductase [Hyphomicrobiales bacterium]|nr:FAD-dependent oxidoreductase [Hyphomicrobiales bacterium]
MSESLPVRKYDVVIVGGGPAGLAAAQALKVAGVKRVVVLEREVEAGGTPRHCGHPPFGMREFRRILTGPRYARQLVREAERQQIDIKTGCTVIRLEEGGRLLVRAPTGLYYFEGGRVLLATGTRETTRAGRLIGGTRPIGVLNTGALQKMVYLHNQVPFRRPVIIGTELVSFSALLTCWRARIRPVAMVERNKRTTAFRPSAALAALFRVPLHYETKLIEVCGSERVRSVTVRKTDGTTDQILCDGVLFTGLFTPESSLARMSHLALDPGTGGPTVDELGRCSDPSYYAAGNLLRPVETAGWCWREGRAIGKSIAQDLAGNSPGRAAIEIRTSGPIKFSVPQRLSITTGKAGLTFIQLRLSETARGSLCIRQNGRLISRKRIRSRPERRLLVSLPGLSNIEADQPLTISLEKD